VALAACVCLRVVLVRALAERESSSPSVAQANVPSRAERSRRQQTDTSRHSTHARWNRGTGSNQQRTMCKNEFPSPTCSVVLRRFKQFLVFGYRYLFVQSQNITSKLILNPNIKFK
jgi:hypothetical protein